MKPVAVGQFLVIDPRICHGKMTFKGTRVPVETVLSFLGQGETIEQIVESWPELTPDAVEEAIWLATAAWPELLRESVEKTIRELATALPRRQTRSANRIHEPAHPGRSA